MESKHSKSRLISLFCFLVIGVIVFCLAEQNFIVLWQFKGFKDKNFVSLSNKELNDEEFNDEEWCDRYPSRRRTQDDSIQNVITPNMICDEWYNDESKKSISNAWLTRSCLFNNYSLCYDIDQNKFIYTSKYIFFNNNMTLQQFNQEMNKKFVNKHIEAHTTRSYSLKKNFRVLFTIGNNSNSNVNEKVYKHETFSYLGTHTAHSGNIGHNIYDVYLTIYNNVNNFAKCGLSGKLDIDFFMLNPGNYKNIFDKKFGPILFNSLENLHNLINKYKTQNYNKICFKNAIVGSGERSGLNSGNIHLNQHVLKFLRKKILNYYNISSFFKPEKLNILVLRKETSNWKRKNFMENFDQFKEELLNKYGNDNRVNEIEFMVPGKTSLENQVRSISKSCIIITQLGAVGFLDFLQPFGCIQIIISQWSRVNKYTKDRFPWINLPDHDNKVHMTDTLHIVIKYFDGDDNYNDQGPYQVKFDIMFPLIEKAVKMASSM